MTGVVPVNPQPNEINSNGGGVSPIFDIIQSIQSKLNEPNNAITEKEQIKSKKDLSEFDIPKMLELLSSMGIKKNTEESPLSGILNQNFDLSSIMKFQKAFSGVNQADPRKNLLYSLKPFLRETRQKNIDTYVTLIGVITALNIFSDKDRD